MEFMDNTHDGARALLCVVMNYAIRDATSFRQPRSIAKIREKGKLKRNELAKIRGELISCIKSYNYYPGDPVLLGLLVGEKIRKIFYAISPDRFGKEEKAYQARQFLSPHNKIFCEYMELLGIDPIVASRNIQKEIAYFDETGKKRRMKKIIRNPLDTISHYIYSENINKSFASGRREIY